MIVYGTGFKATEFLAPMRVTGSGGKSLADEWADGARAHLGITMPGFPNLFVVYGPNTNLGGSSILSMIECQTGWIGQAVELLQAGGPRPTSRYAVDVASAYDREMQERLAGSVWTGCASWYRTDGGRITTNWPGTVQEYRERTADPRPGRARRGRPRPRRHAWTARASGRARRLARQSRWPSPSDCSSAPSGRAPSTRSAAPASAPSPWRRSSACSRRWLPWVVAAVLLAGTRGDGGDELLGLARQWTRD